MFGVQSTNVRKNGIGKQIRSINDYFFCFEAMIILINPDSCHEENWQKWRGTTIS